MVKKNIENVSHSMLIRVILAARDGISHSKKLN